MQTRFKFTGAFRKNLVLRFLTLLLSVFVTMSVAQAQLEPDPRPLDEQPYLGISIRHDVAANKCLVGWIYPGPLEGTGVRSKYLNRSDYILYVGETAVHTPDEFTAAVRRYRPGEMIELQVHDTEGDIDGSIPKAGQGDIIKMVKVKLDARADWVGPVAWLKPERERVVPQRLIPIDADRTEFEIFLEGYLIEHELAQPLADLSEYLSDTLDKNYGINLLDRVAYGFRRPTRLPELQQLITDPLSRIPGDPTAVLNEAALNLDLEPGFFAVEIQFTTPGESLAALADLMQTSSALLDEAFRGLEAGRIEELRETYPELLQFVADNFYINEHPEVQRLIQALNASRAVDFQALLESAQALGGLMSRTPDSNRETAGWDPLALSGAAIPIPNDLFSAITGEIWAIQRSAAGGWLVFGGDGKNTYDLSKIEAVIDAGGDDVYRYSTNERPAIQVVVDLKGNDQYLADAGVRGPASALGGISLLVDHAGNDTYGGSAQSCGVGVLGFGILVDHAGADTYSGTAWSNGAGFYGSGAILDLGAGNDVYTTHYFSQAIGGPRGFGLILDEKGRDLYRNNGPITSVYGSEAVYAGISQGIGFGVRGYDTGGIGVLCDLSGDDRYEAGEFSQGGGYYWGLGVLYDKAGRDLYYGNRYTQGFAAHQALGILADDAGDDTYWGMTAATQSGSWDICSTLLIDRAGDDTYQADGLSQGGASMQALAWFIDLGGNDRYSAPGGATMGQSGGNSYHYDATKCFSFSFFLDAGGSPDFYSRSDRGDGLTVVTGAFNDTKPENSSLHGLFIDTAESLDFKP